MKTIQCGSGLQILAHDSTAAGAYVSKYTEDDSYPLGSGPGMQVEGPYTRLSSANPTRTVVDAVVIVVPMVVVTDANSVRYTGVTVVVDDLVTIGVKHEHASERTELEKSLKSNNRYSSRCIRCTRRNRNSAFLSSLNESLHHGNLRIAANCNGGRVTVPTPINAGQT